MTIEERMKEEDQVREKTDEKGNKWRKLYFGGEAHLRNWLEQSKEIYGGEDIEIEEVKSNHPPGMSFYPKSELSCEIDFVKEFC